jgi:hypothetical protein
MREGWRRACVGLSSGLFQSPSYLLPQFIAAIGLTVGASHADLAWVAPLGFLVPVLVGLAQAAGDLIGGRALILSSAAMTLAGVVLIAAGGLAAALQAHTPALVAVAIGACLVPAAVRHGALVVVHETRELDGEGQLRASRALRRYLVLGIYLIPLPAGIVAERLGWLWVFLGLAVLQLAALAAMARLIRTTPRPALERSRHYMRELALGFADRRLQLAAAGALLAQATVFAYVGGLPVVLAARGYPASWIAGIVFAAVLAAVFVARPRTSSARFGRIAGIAPTAGALVVAAAALGADRVVGSALAPALVLCVLAYAVGSVLMELAKQWSQSLAMLQARAGARREEDHRRQAVVGLGANLGAIVGAGLGPVAAFGAEVAWLALLLTGAAVAWTLQATWFCTAPRKLRDIGPGHSRWRHAGREYIVVIGTYALGEQWAAIFDAPARSDAIRLDRQRAGFEPASTTVEHELERLRRRR